MEFNAERKPGVYARVGERDGLTDADRRAHDRRGRIAAPRHRPRPAACAQHGVTESQLDALADQAFADACHQTNPVPVTRDDLCAALPARRCDDDATPTAPFIDGELRAGARRAHRDHQPRDRRDVARSRRPPAPTTSIAPCAARSARSSRTWRDLTPGKRAEILFAIARLIREHRDELAQLDMRSVGKPIADARDEVVLGARIFEYYAGAIGTFCGQTIPVAARRVRLHAPPADGRGRGDRAVELPVPDRLLEGRARAGGGKLASCSSPPSPRRCRALRLARTRARGRSAGRRASSPARRRQRRRRSARHAPARPQDLLHRLDGRRLAHHAARRARHQTRLARARRQVAEHRLRRRRPRAGRDAIADERLRQRRPGLLRPQPRVRRAAGVRRVRRPLRRRDARRSSSAIRPTRRRRSARSSPRSSARRSKSSSTPPKPQAPTFACGGERRRRARATSSRPPSSSAASRPTASGAKKSSAPSSASARSTTKSRCSAR